ncbi:MAG: TIGR03936 family radical SAM-associated protein [Oscillospiraceae bacterium]|nr:TIGR03936 family radical SAM-associated protein [Oscillospiraceae bacterium]
MPEPFDQMLPGARSCGGHRGCRIRFEKRGRAKYISHLDLMRAMSRAVRQAGIPLWYTEGFHPHPYLSFPLPLPLGQESLCEAMDLRLEQNMPLTEIREGLNAILPEGLRVLSVAEPWNESGEIHAADYVVGCDFISEARASDWKSRAGELLGAGELRAAKRGKQGRRKIEKEIRLAEYIHRWSLEQNGAGVTLRLRLAAGSAANLNPALLCGALFAGAGEPADWSVTRTALLREDGADWE